MLAGARGRGERRRAQARAEGRQASDGQPEGADDAVHGLVLPPHGAAAVRRAVPEAGTRRVQPRSVLLHNHTGHDVLKWLSQLGELA